MHQDPHVSNTGRPGRGFRLRHEAGFLVTTPDGTELGVVKTKEQAYALLRRTAMDQGKKLAEVAAALILAAELLK